MRSKTEIEAFLSNWVTENVHGGSWSANLPYELDCLAARLTGDARRQGISGSDLNRAVGDIDDYLTKQCHQHAGAR